MELRNLKIKEYTEDHYHTPYCIIADVIHEFISNVKGNITKMLKNQPILAPNGDVIKEAPKNGLTEFTFKKRKIERKLKSMSIESHYTNEKGFYSSRMGQIKILDMDFKWTDIEHDYKLIYDKYTNKYYIHVPQYVESKQQPEDDDRNEIASMDPGEKTFQTVYGLDHVIFIGQKTSKVIWNRLEKIDTKKKKNKKKTKTKSRKRNRNYKKAIDRHHRKIDHYVDELHNKTTIYLCRNYKRVMVTDFSSKKVNSKSGNLNKKSKRILGKLSHYRFRGKLQNKCEEYGTQYLEVNEAYTSKTCCKCGTIKKDLAGKRIYECDQCGFKCDRDVHGSINIFLKNRDKVLI